MDFRQYLLSLGYVNYYVDLCNKKSKSLEKLPKEKFDNYSSLGMVQSYFIIGDPNLANRYCKFFKNKTLQPPMFIWGLHETKGHHPPVLISPRPVFWDNEMQELLVKHSFENTNEDLFKRCWKQSVIDNHSLTSEEISQIIKEIDNCDFSEMFNLPKENCKKLQISEKNVCRLNYDELLDKDIDELIRRVSALTDILYFAKYYPYYPPFEHLFEQARKVEYAYGGWDKSCRIFTNLDPTEMYPESGIVTGEDWRLFYSNSNLEDVLKWVNNEIVIQMDILPAKTIQIRTQIAANMLLNVGKPSHYKTFPKYGSGYSKPLHCNAIERLENNLFNNVQLLRTAWEKYKEWQLEELKIARELCNRKLIVS